MHSRPGRRGSVRASGAAAGATRPDRSGGSRADARPSCAVATPGHVPIACYNQPHTSSGGTHAQIVIARHRSPLRIDRTGTDTDGTGPTLRTLGGADRRRVPGCHHPRAGHVPAPDRHHGEAWSASPARQRPAPRPVRVAQCRAAGVRGRVSRVLLRADLRGEAPARHRRVQPRAAAPAAAGDDGRDGPQWLQEDHHHQRPRREPQPADLLRAVAARVATRLRRVLPGIRAQRAG